MSDAFTRIADAAATARVLVRDAVHLIDCGEPGKARRKLDHAERLLWNALFPGASTGCPICGRHESHTHPEREE